MRRREFIAGLSATAAWVLAARAQQTPSPVIGFIGSGAIDAPRLNGLRQGLTEAGYTVGRNAMLDERWADGHYERLADIAHEFVQRSVNVIVAAGLPAALAAKRATANIPVVFASGADPVVMGLVPSLNNPGGNLTGVSLVFGELGAKRLELLRELAPAVDDVAILMNPSNPNSSDHLSSISRAASVTRHRVKVLNASNAAEIERAAQDIDPKHGLLVSDDPVFASHRERLVALAARAKVPAIYFTGEFVAAGGLISYGPNFTESYRQVGLYVGRILSGAKPSELPILQPTKFELSINLKTAKELGLSVPPILLARADEVVE
jgi:putative tryptophan/tyrosine transport system substrate-binding protein